MGSRIGVKKIRVRVCAVSMRDQKQIQQKTNELHLMSETFHTHTRPSIEREMTEGGARTHAGSVRGDGYIGAVRVSF